ncbi:shikimate dehydrogenase [Mangrovimonas yunxiaonensis]|uniref:shikimate dehydrogenase (NADP(+)) n=1 Tax=Mangrovimonas yunxiaonensis TaxID=1197477 RepID=A0A084TIN3_9FLAO|nr:shikimate dehydrogenase [Mangrovimonas yunxiaonensis]KFB00569.1 shikimate dehydrogenase [Mangrovimonas yunxiaonensis]GGH47085.1 shikimate 5-dehydrogenase [Mangrovimonas yunxiaonensis]
MDKFGLIGRNISYSFSKAYFSKKFEQENINATYDNFDIDSIEHFKAIIKTTKHLKGLNVTIPYKESIMPYLDSIDKKAKKIGAVNTIKITKKGKLKGYNTDCYGFKKSLAPLLEDHHKRALILGTGGASKAIAYALKKSHIDVNFVSRTASKKGHFTYTGLTKELVEDHQIIVNCTPLGTFPNVDDAPNIPYQGITSAHILYDLVYNPKETAFLNFGKKKGAKTINGLKMLKLQADKAWRIWNK